MAQFRTGDEIAVDDPKYPGVWIVRKVNPTTYAADPKEGGRGLKLPHAMALPASEAREAGPVGIAAPERPEGLRTGALVRIKPGRVRGISDPAALFVVFADKYDTVNVTMLGGDPGRRYWRLPPSCITEVIDPARVTVAAS